MNKILSTVLLILLAGTLWSGEQITVFTTLGKVNLTQFKLKVNIFTKDKVLELNQESELRICESIDNSNLIIFGPFTPSKVYSKLFGTTAVNNSIRELMNRGGCVFFGPTSWTNLASLPKTLTKFFRDYNVPPLNGKMYAALKNQAGKDTYMRTTPNPDYKDELLQKPNDFIANAKSSKYRLMAIRYFANLPKDKFNILFYYKNPDIPLLITSKNIPKGGMMIFTYCYNLFRQTNHPFWKNLIWKVYGPRKKTSAKEQVREKLKSTSKKKGNKITKPVIILKKGALGEAPFLNSTSVKLYNWQKNSVPQKATEVKVNSDPQNLYVSFLCQEPNMEGIVAKLKRKDANIWNDDCVELFISSLDKGSDKYHYIVNSNGIYYDAKNDNPRWNSNLKLNTKRNSNSWQVDLTIPFSELKLADTDNFRINFCREEKQLGELTSWSKTLKFKNPLTFGYATRKDKKTLAEKISASLTITLGNKIIIRPVSPWEKSYPDSFPENTTSELRTDITAARNEKESAVFQISNTYDKNLYFRIEPQVYLSGSKTPWQEVFTLKSAIPWQATTGEVFSEPLVKLNEGNIFILPGLETRNLWVDAKTKLPAGNYKWQFTLIPVNSDIENKRLTVNLKVFPLRFPNQLPVEIFTFGPYGFSWARGSMLRKKYWQTCTDYHINWVQGTEGPVKAITRNPQGKLIVSANPDDYSNNEFRIQKMGLKCVFGYGIYTRFMKRLKKLGEKRTIKSPEIQKLFHKWFSQWISYLKKNNFKFNDALFPLCDEPRADVIDELFIAGEIMHKVDSKVKIPVTIATWSTMIDLKKLNKVVDVWIIWEPRITSRQNAKNELAFLHGTGKKIRPYLCSTSSNTASYLNYFRYRGIRSYLMKCDGFSMWAFNSWRGNDWKSAEDKKQNGAWLFQHGDYGPIATVRAEAFREGIEDLYLLHLGAEILKKKPNKKLEKLISPAYLNLLLDASNPTATQKWRNKLISLISTLK